MKFNIQKTKIMASGLITSWQVDGEKVNSDRFFFPWDPKSLQIVTEVMKLKDAPWKKSNKEPRQHMKKQRHHFANKGPYGLSYGFSLLAQMVKNLPAIQKTWV